jgi:hypothetical protein
MSTPKIIKKDPYTARYPEFNTFFYCYVLWYLLGPCNLLLLNGKCTASPKIPFLRYYRTNGVIPAVSMALFAGHIVDQKEKKSLLVKCILAFQCFGLFLLTWPAVVQDYSLRTILYSIYF